MNLVDHLRLGFERNRQSRNIRRHGWTGVYVGDYHHAPSWAYTIGFDETLDHPELVAFDLPTSSANQLFWWAFSDLRSEALVIKDGLQWPPDQDEGRCVWRKVRPEHIDEWLTLACMRRFDRTGSRTGLQAYQFVLPDPEGRLPWEAGYDEALRALQPALYDADEGWATESRS